MPEVLMHINHSVRPNLITSATINNCQLNNFFNSPDLQTGHSFVDFDDTEEGEAIQLEELILLEELETSKVAHCSGLLHIFRSWIKL